MNPVVAQMEVHQAQKGQRVDWVPRIHPLVICNAEGVKLGRIIEGSDFIVKISDAFQEVINSISIGLKHQLLMILELIRFPSLLCNFPIADAQRKLIQIKSFLSKYFAQSSRNQASLLLHLPKSILCMGKTLSVDSHLQGVALNMVNAMLVFSE